MKYEILNTQITKRQKLLIRREAFRKKLSQAQLVREIFNTYYQINDDEEPSLRNQDLGDEPTLPCEDEPLDN